MSDTARQAFDLCGAAFKDDVDSLKTLIDSGVDVNLSDYDGRTALHLASDEGHVRSVEYLISAGANVMAEDRWKSTPLRGAIKNFHTDVVTLLQNAGAHLKAVKDVSKGGAEWIEQQEHLNDLFSTICAEGSTTATRADVTKYVASHGFVVESHAVLAAELQKLFGGADADASISFDQFAAHLEGDSDGLLSRIVHGKLHVPNWSRFTADMQALFEEVRDEDTGGANADYIPALAEFDSSLWGLAIVSVDGQEFACGDTDCQFPIESCCKPFMYAFVQEAMGVDETHKHVGQEPSGLAFNAFALTADEELPHNPCINAGAIMTHSLFLDHHRSLSKAFNAFRENLAEMAGGRKCGFSQGVYLSEKETAYTNYALAYYMKSHDAYPEHFDSDLVVKGVDLYLQGCSVEVTCRSVGHLAGALANHGIVPTTGKRVLKTNVVRNTLSVMMSSGMYDYSGQWCVKTGIPAKSGVSGIIYMILPGRVGIAVYSPPLDKIGNSAKGVEFGKRLADKFGAHILDSNVAW